MSDVFTMPYTGDRPFAFVYSGSLYFCGGTIVQKSTDNGATWTELDAAHEPAYNNSEPGWFFDGTLAYCAYRNYSTVYIRSFSPATGTWGSLIASTTLAWPGTLYWPCSVRPDGAYFYPMVLVKRADGAYVIATSTTHNTGGQDYEDVHVLVYDGSWHDQFFDGSSTSTYSVGNPQILLGVSGVVHVFAVRAAATLLAYSGPFILEHRSITGTTLGTLQTIETQLGTASQPNAYVLGYPLLFDNRPALGGGTYAVLPVERPKGLVVLAAVSVSNPTWILQDQINTVGTGGCIAVTGTYAMTLFLSRSYGIEQRAWHDFTPGESWSNLDTIYYDHLPETVLVSGSPYSASPQFDANAIPLPLSGRYGFAFDMQLLEGVQSFWIYVPPAAVASFGNCAY